MATNYCKKNYSKNIPSNKNFNPDINAETVKNIFIGLYQLRQNDSVFKAMRNILKNFSEFLFQDEYNTELCKIDELENEYEKYVSDIVAYNTFKEINTGKLRSIRKIKDLSDAINEFYYRLDGAKRISNNLVSVLLSEDSIKKRKEKCVKYRPNCENPFGEGGLFPCRIKKSGFFSSSKCRYDSPSTMDE
jgi:hypothetical protein